MTEQEAKALVEWFKARKGKTLKLNDNGIDCVVEALEKQIAKKPIVKETDEKKLYRCPCCDKVFVEVYDTVQRGFIPSYCNMCGQAIEQISTI